MLHDYIKFILCLFVLCDCANLYQGQFFEDEADEGIDTTTATPLPFPTCHAVDVDCQRKVLRTFFFMMDSGYLGMKPIDPIILESIAVSFPDQQMSFLMRNVNVTGARWTKLMDRKFNLSGSKSGVVFKSDLHITGLLLTTIATRVEPLLTNITMDLQEVESNITYECTDERINNEDHFLIGLERLAVRNFRMPTYFLQPETEDKVLTDEAIQSRPAILDHLSNEIVAAVMRSIVDNFRLFGSKIPVKYYYKYF